MPDGKHRFTQCCFTDRPEKIGLVFIFIRTGKQLPVFYLSVVAGRDKIGLLRDTPVKKEAELNFAVAKRIGVGRPPFFKLFIKAFQFLWSVKNFSKNIFIYNKRSFFLSIIS